MRKAIYSFILNLVFLLVSIPFFQVNAEVSCPFSKQEMDSFVESGNATAEADQGFYYIKGICGYPLNTERGFELIEKSAFKNNSVGLGHLGYLYIEGIEVKKNAEKAREYFNLSAKAGSHISRAKLGFELVENYFSDKNKKLELQKGMELLVSSAK